MLNIRKIIEVQKQGIINRLIEDSKIPVADVMCFLFNEALFTGKFCIKTDLRTNEFLNFKYENGNFYWNAVDIKNNWDSVWEQVYTNHEAAILKKIHTDLIPVQDIDKITCGKKNILHIYHRNNSVTDVVAEYHNYNWEVKRSDYFISFCVREP